MAKRKRALHKPTPENIPEGEQWRLVKDSGILDDADAKNTKVFQRTPGQVIDNEDIEEEGGDLPDQIFDAILLIIPMCFVYLLMDIMVNQQYAQPITFFGEVKTIASVLPVISFFIFFSLAISFLGLGRFFHSHLVGPSGNNKKSLRLTQIIMFWVSIASGLRLIYVVNHGAWGKVLKQGPPLATIWVYVIVQLNLLPAVLSLVVIAGFVQYLNLKIIL